MKMTMGTKSRKQRLCYTLRTRQIIRYRATATLSNVKAKSVQNSSRPMRSYPCMLQSLKTSLLTAYLGNFIIVSRQRSLPLNLLYIMAPIKATRQHYIMVASLCFALLSRPEYRFCIFDLTKR